MFIYILIEFIYNLIFNRQHAFNKIFIMFIISISLMGVGIGLSFNGISSFTYDDKGDYVTSSHVVEMSDDLILFEINNIDSSKIIIDDALDCLKLDILAYYDSEIFIYSYINSYNDNNGEVNNYRFIDIVSEYNEFDVYKRIVSDLKNKKISSMDYDYYKIDKIYLSSENLNKLKDNYLNYYE